MPDTEGTGKKEPGKREFMREKIVKQPLSHVQIVKRIAAFLCLSILFGAIAAISFVVSKPLADKYLIKETEEESSSIMITKDEPETTASVVYTEPETGETEMEDLEEAIGQVLSEYTFSIDNLNSFYSVIREIGQQSDKGIVTVSSGKQQMDLFGNPVESTGDYAGAVIAKAGGEYLIFTYADAVSQADSITVTFFDGSRAAGLAGQIDEVSGMAVVSVKAEELDAETQEEIKILVLGNSYSVKAGDFVIGAGSPSGIVHSVTYGTISYIARNVKLTDGVTRILYADIHSNSRTGTFLLNTAGELIGWTSDNYKTEENGDVTAAVSISDYKAILEKMINGKQAPFFGIKGQEVNEAMAAGGIPQGVYVAESVAGGPAYDAGIQNGDIITFFGEKEIATFKELQMQIENSECGSQILIKVMRKGREGYQELEYKVDIRAR